MFFMCEESVSVCSDQTGLVLKPVWRTTHLLTLNRKQFDHLLYTKLKPVYQTDQTTHECGLFGLICLNICSLDKKMAATEIFHEIHCTKINCFHRESCFLLFGLDFIIIDYLDSTKYIHSEF